MIKYSLITEPFRSLFYIGNGVFDIEGQWNVAMVSRGMDRYNPHFVVQKESGDMTVSRAAGRVYV